MDISNMIIEKITISKGHIIITTLHISKNIKIHMIYMKKIIMTMKPNYQLRHHLQKMALFLKVQIQIQENKVIVKKIMKTMKIIEILLL